MTNENIIEQLHEKNMLNFVMVALISSDNLIDVDSCEKALKQLELFKEAMVDAKIDNKDYYNQFFIDAETIIKRDLEAFKEKKNG